MAKVTGIGGVFFQSRGDEAALAAWYKDHLGVDIQPWGGAFFEWKNDAAEDGGVTVWRTARDVSDWFAPSDAPFMINYRVDDLTELLAELKAKGVEPIKGPESHENGMFAWITDPDGNKVELWEPMVWDEKNRQG